MSVIGGQVLRSAGGSTLLDGLINYWRLDSGNKSSLVAFPDIIGSLDMYARIDLTDTQIAGKFGGFAFTGSNNLNEILESPNNTDYEFSNQEFSMSAWFRTSDLNNDQIIFGKWWQSINRRFCIQFDHGQAVHKFSAFISSNGGSVELNMFSDVLITADTWTNIYFGYRPYGGSLSDVSIAINGETIITFVGKTRIAISPNQPLVFGGAYGIPNTTSEIRGAMGHVAGWNRLLTQDELAELQLSAYPWP